MALQFNRAEAKAAGYDDAEIDEYLKTATPPETTSPVSYGAGVTTPDYQGVGANYENNITPTVSTPSIRKVKKGLTTEEYQKEYKNLMESYNNDFTTDMQKGGKNRTAIDSFYDMQLKYLESMRAEEEDNPTVEEPKTKGEINEVKDTIGNIDTVLSSDLGFLGFWGGARTSIPGTKTFATGKQIQQIKDQLSLASVGKLKGQGQVSDAERRMLANASTALDVGMTEEDFRKELNKVRGILNRNIGGKAKKNVISQTNIIKNDNKSKELPPWEIEAETPQRKFGFNLDFGKKEDPYNKLKKGGELAKQALNEQDKVKKERLLAESRMLSEQGGEASRATKTNPLIYAGAKAQKFLGETETLPMIYGAIGAGTTGGSAVGTGVGAGYGKILQKSLQHGKPVRERTMPEISKELRGDLGEAAWTGTKYAVTAKILGAGTKYISNALKAKTLSPSKITNFLRDEAAREVPTINTSKILKEGDRLAKLYPNAKEFWDVERTAFKGKLGTKDLLNKITDMGAQSWTKSGDPRVKATAGFMRLLYKKAREDILRQAPNVAKYTKTLAQLKDVPEWIKTGKRATWELLKLLGIIKLAQSGRAID